MGDCLCDQCAGLCCRYFALPIDNPSTRRDYDNIRWYLLHENVTVFIEKKQWYIGIANRCKQLQGDNRCGIYLTRPKVCRGYSTENCDWHGGDYQFESLFTSADQLERYAKEKLLAERARKRKRKTLADARRRGNAARPHSAKPESARRPRTDMRKLSEALTRRMETITQPTVNGRGVANVLSPKR